MDFCPHCMHALDEEAFTFCPQCGGDLKWAGAENHLPVGSVLTGSGGLRTYQIGAARGQGGFGITYIALELSSQKRVAVKEFYPTRCAYRGGDRAAVLVMTGQDDIFQSGLKSFLDEARMVAAHDDLPTVVRVIDYFQANNTAYLVMEYLDGVPLHEKMSQMGGRLPAQEFVPKLPPLLRDLGQLHQSGVIHRDISPDNLMWMPDGSLKLLDFGCARSMEGGKSMTVLLKHGFAPIEQYRTRGQGPFTDVYALAATIYYCVTGQVPPPAMDRLENDTLQSPIALGASLTVQQETALLWALSIQPHARPQTMEEFAQMLFSAPAPGPSPAPGPTPGPAPGPGPAPAPKPARTLNKPALAGAAAVLLAVLIGTAIYFANRSSQAGHDPHSTYSRRVSTPEPTRTPRPTPSPTPAVNTATTADGFVCEIVNGEAAITGYNGRGLIYSLPDEINDVPITAIADNAFAGAEVGDSILLPLQLETIGANAFRGCTSLKQIFAYSDVSITASSFSGCTNLRCVHVTPSSSMSGWALLDQCQVVQTGMDLEAGTLSYSSQVGSYGEVYGITTDEQAVLIAVPAGVTSLTIPDQVGTGYPVVWVRSGALDRASSGISIQLAADTCYNYSLQNSASWYGEDGTLAEAWIFTCSLADAINAARSSLGEAQISPDISTVRVAMTRVQELTALYDADRPDGRSWSTVLDDEGVNWQHAKSVRGHNYSSLYGDSGLIQKAAAYVAENYSYALTTEDTETNAGKYLDSIGGAYTYDGENYLWSCFAILT